MDAQFFKDIYFANYTALVNDDITDAIKQFKIRIPEGQYINGFEDFIMITAEEILKMSYDAWYCQKERAKLIGDETINPSVIFSNIVNCMVLLKMDVKNFEVNYYKYYNLEISIGDDEEWFDNEEMVEYQDKGFRKIDLELINATAKRNKPLVIELMNKGANPYIDPDEDGIDESVVLDSLGNAYHLGFSIHSGYWADYILNEYITDNEFLDMVRYLFCAASADNLYRTITGYKEQDGKVKVDK